MTGQQIFEMASTLFDEPEKGKFDKSPYTEIVRRVLNQGYREVCRKALCSRASSSVNTNTSVREYSFPEGCSSLISIKHNGIPLVFIREFDICSTLKGMPQAYYIAIDKIGLEPIPDKTYTLNLIYFQKPANEIQMEDTPYLVPEDWHYVIAYYMVKEFFKIDKGDSSQGFLKWESIYEDELFKMKNYFVEGINANHYLEVR